MPSYILCHLSNEPRKNRNGGIKLLSSRGIRERPCPSPKTLLQISGRNQVGKHFLSTETNSWWISFHKEQVVFGVADLPCIKSPFSKPQNSYIPLKNNLVLYESPNSLFLYIGNMKGLRHATPMRTPRQGRRPQPRGKGPWPRPARTSAQGRRGAAESLGFYVNVFSPFLKWEEAGPNKTSYSLCFTCFFYLLIFWPRPAACGILTPQPGMEPTPPALEARSLNYWTAREVPTCFYM